MQLASVCRHPIRSRSAIQSSVITVCAHSRVAIRAFPASVLRRLPNSTSVQPRRRRSSRTSRSALCPSVSSIPDSTIAGAGTFYVGWISQGYVQDRGPGPAAPATSGRVRSKARR